MPAGMRFPDGQRTLADTATGQSISLLVNGNVATALFDVFDYNPTTGLYVGRKTDVVLEPLTGSLPGTWRGYCGTPPNQGTFQGGYT